MQITRFGDTFDEAFEFPVFKASQQWQSTRPPVLQKVGGTDGAFDFAGSGPSPVDPISAKLTFDIGGGYWLNAGGLYTCSGGAVGANSRNWKPFDYANLFTQLYNTDYQVKFGSEIHALSSVAAASLGISGTWATPGTGPLSILPATKYATVDTELERLCYWLMHGKRSKVWGTLRDGSSRWAWAKCNSVIPTIQTNSRLSTTVEVDLTLSEGRWYGATSNDFLYSPGDSQPYAVYQHGNVAASVVIALAPTSGHISRATFTNHYEGGSCTLTITFTPKAVGFAPGTITLNYTPEPTGSPQVIYLRGTGQ